MTNLHLALISALVSLIAGSVGFYFLRTHITSEFDRLELLLHTRADHIVDSLAHTERSVRSHVVDEIDSVVRHTAAIGAEGKLDLQIVRDDVINFVKTHADELSQAAASIKAHSIETHDRAVSRDIAPRQAVTR